MIYEAGTKDSSTGKEEKNEKGEKRKEKMEEMMGGKYLSSVNHIYLFCLFVCCFCLLFQAAADPYWFLRNYRPWAFRQHVSQSFAKHNLTFLLYFLSVLNPFINLCNFVSGRRLSLSSKYLLLLVFKATRLVNHKVSLGFRIHL